MTLEYTYGRAQLLAELRHRGEPGIPEVRASYYQHCAQYWLLYAFGAWLAYQQEHIFGMGIFVWMLLYSMYQQLPYSKVLEDEYQRYGQSMKDRHISLSVDAEGLTETESGIVSFSPWSSVVGYQYFDSILVIELTTGEQAIIDESTLVGDIRSLQGLIESLDDHKIAAEKTLTE